MVKNHLKAIAAPKTWHISRKDTAFVMNPNPGSYSLELGIPVHVLLRNELHLSKTKKESRTILNSGSCFVNGRVVKDTNTLVGLFDVVSIPSLKIYTRLILSPKGFLSLLSIPESESTIILSKLLNKSILKGKKIQLNALGGRNFLTSKDDFTTSTTLVLEVPGYKITNSLPLQTGATILLIGGKHIGTIASVKHVDSDKITFVAQNHTYETLAKFAFVIGKDKPLITVQI